MKTPPITLIILRIAAILVLVESAIIYLLTDTRFNIGSTIEPFAHVFMLFVLSAPLFYIWVIRPYIVLQNDCIDQIRHLSHHDQLTKLPNRRLLSEYTEKLISSFVRHKYFGALLYIDLDGFKIINDYHGYEIGDEILIEVSRRLSSLVRGEDIVGRVGGNEFVIVLDQLGIDEERANSRAVMVIERIHGELCVAVNTKGKTLHVEASIGMCILTPERTSVETALKSADSDMRYNRKARK